jgi:hypothetical protein
MSGAIPPLPQYAFMAWCSIKNTGTTLLLPLFNKLINCVCMMRKQIKYALSILQDSVNVNFK